MGIIIAFLPLISLLCTGCSTLLTINSGEPYSGVKCNIEGIQKTFDTSTPYYLMPHWAEGIFSTIDLPLSVVGDTILLPYAFLKKDRPHGVETPQFWERRAWEFPESGENRF
jgi:uncharacterized protein YceK